jgi:hypothetical protein
VKPLDFPSPTQLENKKNRMQPDAFCFFAVAYLSPHISINIVEFSGPPTLRRGDSGGGQQQTIYIQHSPRQGIGRQQPWFLVNLVELAGRSINIFLKKGRNLWPE